MQGETLKLDISNSWYRRVFEIYGISLLIVDPVVLTRFKHWKWGVWLQYSQTWNTTDFLPKPE